VTGGLWRLGGLSIPAASVGVWGVDGLWTLQYPKVTKQAEFLIKVRRSQQLYGRWILIAQFSP
jgi:hypothetical protein